MSLNRSSNSNGFNDEGSETLVATPSQSSSSSSLLGAMRMQKSHSFSDFRSLSSGNGPKTATKIFTPASDVKMRKSTSVTSGLSSLDSSDQLTMRQNDSRCSLVGIEEQDDDEATLKAAFEAVMAQEKIRAAALEEVKKAQAAAQAAAKAESFSKRAPLPAAATLLQRNDPENKPVTIPPAGIFKRTPSKLSSVSSATGHEDADARLDSARQETDAVTRAKLK